MTGQRKRLPSRQRIDSVRCISLLAEWPEANIALSGDFQLVDPGAC